MILVKVKLNELNWEQTRASVMNYLLDRPIVKWCNDRHMPIKIMYLENIDKTVEVLVSCDEITPEEETFLMMKYSYPVTSTQ